MNGPDEMTEAFPRKESCTVLVLYEDVVTRQRGMAACDYLVQNFWADFEFEFQWWRTDFLADQALAAAAAEKASQASLIFLCSPASWEPSATLKAWFDSWIESRLEREGLLVNLLTGNAPAEKPHAGEVFLRDISRRAELDYLGPFPSTSAGFRPPSFTAAEATGIKLSAGLDGRVRELPPPHFGIND